MYKLYPAIFVNMYCIVLVIKISTQIVPSLQYDVIVVKKRRKEEEKKSKNLLLSEWIGVIQKCFH